MNHVLCGTRTPYFADFLWSPPDFRLSGHRRGRGAHIPLVDEIMCDRVQRRHDPAFPPRRKPGGIM